MGYDFWWIAGSEIAILLFASLLFFSLLALMYEWKKSIAISTLVLGFLFFSSIVGAGFLANSYTIHYRKLRASETKAIYHAIKEKPLSVVDEGQDPQFSDFRDVLILMPGGVQENFYYNPSNGKVIFKGIQVSNVQ